jgi:peptidoglycan/xylan/chitin deacetylase (PgdA/CDA1 family)
MIIISGGITLLVVVVAVAYVSPYIWRYMRVYFLRKKLARSQTLVLTFDDGPSEFTPRLLDILRSHGAKASFFMLGCNAKQHPAIADRILREGHEVGCHSDQHLNAWKVMPQRAISDINAGYKSLSNWVRSDGTFRPPYGKITLPTYLAVRKRGAALAWWTIVSGDTETPLPSPRDVVETVEKANGGVVLMHDFSGSVDHSDFVCETTELLLKMAQQQSLRVKCLSDSDLDL